MLDCKDAILAAVEKEATIQIEIETLQASILKIDKELQTIKNLIADIEKEIVVKNGNLNLLSHDKKIIDIAQRISDLTRELKEVEAIVVDELPDIKEIRFKISQLTNKQELLKKKDPSCISKICSFIVDGLKAAEDFESIIERLDNVLKTATSEKYEKKKGIELTLKHAKINLLEAAEKKEAEKSGIVGEITSMNYERME